MYLIYPFVFQMSMDQVRWKINALIKKYKECVDNNSKSGRSLMTFKCFTQMDEIFGRKRNAVTEHTVSSQFPSICNKPSTCNKSSTKESHLSVSTSVLTELKNDSNLSSQVRLLNENH